MKFQIPACFDSHVHLLPTGEMLSIPQLHEAGDLQSWGPLIQAMPLRQGWRLAFGWDPQQFPLLQDLSATLLEKLSPGIPLLVSRRDGHSGCLNQTALELWGWQRASDLPSALHSGVEIDSKGLVTGILREEAYFEALRRLPSVQFQDRLDDLRRAQKCFLEAGFTHLREMMGDPLLLEALATLDSDPEWFLRTEIFLHHSPGRPQALSSLLQAARDFNLPKRKKSRVIGVKFFLDGALGSETAFLSAAYLGRDHHGESLWSSEELKQDLAAVWRVGLRAAVHCIGDASLQQVLEIAQQLKVEGLEGGLSIEHAEVIHPESEPWMDGLDLEFHFQPSHVLSDRIWLREKLGERLAWCFPWKRIEEIGFPLFFGSDSPIERPSLKRTREGLLAAQDLGIPLCELDWKYAHSHPDPVWAKGAVTTMTEWGDVLSVSLEGKILFKNESLL